MLVSPASVVVSAPVVADLAPDEVTARTTHVVDAVRAMGPRAREAAGALLGRLAWHRRQRVGSRLDVAELCPEYFVAAGDAARSTAHRVWQALRPIVGWLEIGYHTARAIGVEVRRLPDGVHRHGRFLIVPPEVTAVARAAAGLLGLPEREGRLGPAFVVAAARGGSGRVLCPWHDDHRPSLTLARDGSCRCYACGASGRWSDGPNGVEVRRLRPGQRRGSTADGYIPGANTVRGTGTGGTGTATGDQLHPASRTAVPWSARAPTRTATGRHVVRSVTPGGVSQTAREGEDLIGLLVRIDRYHAARVARIPPASCLRESTIPDRYVTLDRQIPTGFMARRFGDRRVAVPSGFRPIVSRWVMLDFDDADDAPIDADGDPRWWGREVGPAVERAVRAALPGEVTGRILVQRSGLRGLHVLVELAHDHAPWTADPDRRIWSALAGAVAPVLHRWFPGAVADPRAVGPNRCIRAPGLRRLKPREGGIPFVVRVAYASC